MHLFQVPPIHQYQAFQYLLISLKLLLQLHQFYLQFQISQYFLTCLLLHRRGHLKLLLHLLVILLLFLEHRLNQHFQLILGHLQQHCQQHLEEKSFSLRCFGRKFQRHPQNQIIPKFVRYSASKPQSNRIESRIEPLCYFRLIIYGCIDFW